MVYKKLQQALSLTFILALLLSPVAAGAAVVDDYRMVRQIVVFREGVTDSRRDALLRTAGAERNRDLRRARAVSVNLPAVVAERLANRPEVERIEEDLILSIDQTTRPPRPSRRTLLPTPDTTAAAPVTQSSLQPVPWNIARVNAPPAWNASTGQGVKVAILDTGIQLNHPDLQASIKGNINLTNPRRNGEDDNGHGTHVAGVIGALNNAIGVVGVAPQTDLYAVKVLDRRGSGFLSDIIAGMDWAIDNNMQVVNMSFGTTSYSALLDAAVKRLDAAGIIQVAASGNGGTGAISYPGRFAEVIAVGAVTNTDTRASFSNHGAELEFVAPGQNIYSTDRRGRYSNKSGTSMATPHVSGAVALLLAFPQSCDTNGDNRCDLAEVRTALIGAAEDLGSPGHDPQFGFGLVNAAGAIGL